VFQDERGWFFLGGGVVNVLAWISAKDPISVGTGMA
jgi:hypothetical protein